MRKILLLFVSFALAFSASAQKDVITKKALKMKAYKTHEKSRLDDAVYYLDNEVPAGEMVGLSNYDLQTNSSVAKRIINHGDGTVSLDFIQYQGVTMPAAPDRGTGYNFYDGSSWQYTSVSGNERVDPAQRTGWPTLVVTGDGKELVLSHIRTGNGLYGASQTIGATGSNWTIQNADAAEEIAWPRSAASGDNVYAIGVVDRDASLNGGYLPIFMRSTDNGATWGGLETLPGAGTEFYYGLGGDSYAIDASGDNVAIAYFASFGDIAVWKSIDNGENWTKTIIMDVPSEVDGYDPYSATAVLDVDNDGVMDSLFTSDNCGDVIIDNDGKVHVVFGIMKHLDAAGAPAPGYGATSYFPGYDGLIYWNEDMGAATHPGGVYSDSYVVGELPAAADVVIADSPDLNGDGELTYAEVGAQEFAFGTYGTGMTSFPSLGINEDNEIFLVYSTVMETAAFWKQNANPNSQSYRHSWITKRATDGTWGPHGCITKSDGSLAENVFTVLARKVDGETCYVFTQWDDEPGCSLKDVGDPITDNYMVYKSFTYTQAITAVSVENINNNISIKVFPNPTSDFLRISAKDVSKVELYNILGSKVISTNTTTVNLKELTNGVYILKVYTPAGIVTKKIQKM